MKTRMPTSRCPSCGDAHDAASGVDHDQTPSPGDITVCINCGAVNVFTQKLTLRSSTLAERSACGPELEQIVAAIAIRGRRR